MGMYCMEFLVIKQAAKPDREGRAKLKVMNLAAESPDFLVKLAGHSGQGAKLKFELPGVHVPHQFYRSDFRPTANHPPENMQDFLWIIVTIHYFQIPRLNVFIFKGANNNIYFKWYLYCKQANDTYGGSIYSHTVNKII